MVRQANALEVGHHLGRREHVAEPGARHRERLGERAHHGDVRVVGDQLQRALAAELDVGLVDHDQRRRGVREFGDRLHGLGVAGRVVGRAHEHHVGLVGEGLLDRVLVEDERVVHTMRDHLGVREPGQARVQQVRGFEDRGSLPGAAVGEQQLGEDLVRAVRGPRALEGVTVVGRDLLAQAGHLPVRIPVQGKVPDRIGQRIGERLGATGVDTRWC